MINETACAANLPKRNLALRILFGFLWLVAFYFITNMLVGGVVGAISGASSGTSSDPQSFSEGFHQGQNAGRQAARAFFHKYGLIVFLIQIVVFTALCAFSVLPGVGRYKKNA